MKVRTVKLHPLHKPIPQGWSKLGSAGQHREHHAMLIGRKSKPKRQQPELALHKAVARYLDLALDPETTWWTTIPAGGGGKARGAKLKAMGYKAGTPDILIVHRGRAYFVELKDKNGVLSRAQVSVLKGLDRISFGCWTICWNISDLMETLTRRWSIPLRARPT